MQENESRMGFARVAVFCALSLAIGLAAGLTLGAGNARFLDDIPLLNAGLDPTPDPSVDLSEFWKAWNVLEERFIETHASSTLPTAKERIWGAIEGLTESYGDPYTVFMRPEDAKVFKEDIAGNFSGVGMEIGLSKEGTLTVIAPLKGTPAEHAGIRPGDQIIGIDGKPTEGFTTEAAVKLIRGEKGTTVTFQILREGETLEIPVVRDTIQIPIIEAGYDAATGVYTISFYSFSANSGSLWNRAIAEFRASGASRLLIDLRGNPGGYLESAVAIASTLLPEGAVIVTEDYDGNHENVIHRSRGTGGVPETARIAILIDQGSASASEILAGALQDADRATLIGMPSFGKGSVQELVNVGGGSLKITIAKWLTPGGTSISDGGLTPDIEIERTQEDFTAGRDPQKDRAIQFLTTGR